MNLPSYVNRHWLFLAADGNFAKSFLLEDFPIIVEFLDKISPETLNLIKEQYKQEFEKNAFTMSELKGYRFTYDSIEKLYLTLIETKIEEIKKSGPKYISIITSVMESKINCISDLHRQICNFTKNKNDLFYLISED